MVGMTAPATLDFYAAMQRLLGPYTFDGAALHVTVVRDSGLGVHVEIDATLQPVDPPESPTLRQVRQALLESANRAIDAVEAFGFRHLTAPCIEFGGQVAHRMHKDPIIITECRMRLDLKPPTD
jgi:hypothetical protein